MTGYTIFYARVSTTDQNADIQAAQARQMGFHIDEVVEDAGVSGLSKRMADRPGGARVLDKLRRGDQLIVRWVDRLGRNYEDVTGTIRELMRRGVTIRTVINGMTFDGATQDPVQQAVRDALIGFMAATAQAQAEATAVAQKAGIAANKDKEGRQGRTARYLGKKPSYDRETFDKVTDMLGQEAGASAISKETGLSRQAVLRIRDHRAEAEAALARWGK